MIAASALVAQDLAAYREAESEDDGFRIPHDLLSRELAGEAPVRLWREHRGLTQEALAEAADTRPGACRPSETVGVPGRLTPDGLWASMVGHLLFVPCL